MIVAVGAGIGGLVVALLASEALVEAVSRLGLRYHITASVLGLLVALGADAPEVTSAAVALSRGSTDVGLGVVLGSNIYNLAGLLGLSAVLAGAVSSGPRALAMDDAVNLVLTGCVICVLVVPAVHFAGAVLIFLVFAAYVYATASGLDRRMGWARPSSHLDSAPSAATAWTTRTTVLAIGASVILIVAGSAALVQSALYIGPRAGISDTIIGTIVLAVATSLPNTWAAVSLSRRGMSASAIGATFNSNSINLTAAIAVPSLFVTLHAAPVSRGFDLAWLSGMTILAVVLLSIHHSLSRRSGMGLLALYAVFAVLRVTVAR